MSRRGERESYILDFGRHSVRVSENSIYIDFLGAFIQLERIAQ